MSRPRRVNDAQVERLLAAMKDARYRSELAKKLVAKENVKQFTRTGKTTAEWKRRYSSTMRRFQRYVTTSGEKRSFARAPVVYQREARAVARELPALPPARSLPLPSQVSRPKSQVEEEEFELTPPSYESTRDISLYDLRAIVAYYDGDVNEAARSMSLSDRGERLLDLAVTGEGVDVLAMRGAGELTDQARELFDSLPSRDAQDIDDFHDLLMNLPDWQIGMILADLEDENTTFADWLDAWRDDGMDLDVSESEYWALWRQAYARAKA